MILVQVQNWLQVLIGSTSPDEAVLKDWPGVRENDLKRYGDVLVGLYRNTVVAAYDIDQLATTLTEGGARFAGKPSTDWAHLVGQSNPGKPWSPQGHPEPVQFLDSTLVPRTAAGAAAVAAGGPGGPGGPGGHQVALDGFVLTVDGNGNAAVAVPAGRSVTMYTAPATTA